MQQKTPLKASLVAHTSPKAMSENIILWNEYRVTVLQSRLFRLERNECKIFRDEATQTVWFRNTPAQTFHVTQNDESAVIDTGECKLILKKNRKDCRVELNGKLLKINNDGNLKGTARTLDICDGDTFYPDLYAGDANKKEKVKLETGVCSRSGVAVFDDAKSLTLAQNGEVLPMRGLGSDEYIFVYGNDYRDAVKALFLITGATPKIPRYALGNWWSRYHDYTEKEYLTLLNGFERKNVPLTVATIDMDWHYSGDLNETFQIEKQGRNSEFYGGSWGWTGYSWNTKLFPDYRGFLQKIKDKNLKITLNLHPADGFRWWEDCYKQMANAMDVDPDTAERVAFDITNNQFINAYFDIAHKPYEKDGVAFWWIDWQQGETSSVEGLDPLWSLNHYHYLDNAENNAEPLVLSRYAGIGSHRYPLGFSGDTFVTWKTLKYLPYFTATASNVGYTWWSHDIGGHQRGIQDNEMYLRHVQYGVLSPVNRLHCSNLSTMTKEPWAYENGAGKIAEDWLRFRHALIPFLYTQSYRTHKHGKALIEPLYYEWKNEEAYCFPTEYLFGDLLVAPVVEHTKADGYARIKMWIPEGKWTDIFTGDYYQSPVGGKTVTLLRHLESAPVLAKAGTILPLSADEGNSCKNPKKLEIRVYQGNGEFTLYEDGAERNAKGEAFTHFEARFNDTQTLDISFEGDCSVVPAERVLLVSFQDIPEGEISVYQNGEKLPVDELLTDCASVQFSFDPTAKYKVEVKFEQKTYLQRLQAQAQKILLRAEDKHEEKYDVYLAIANANSAEEYRSIVELSELKAATKLRLLETLL